MRIGGIVVVSLGLCSCQSSIARKAMGRGEQLLATDRSTEAVAQFDRAQSLATDSLQKARALVGLGEAQVRSGDYRAARMSLYSARDQLANVDVSSGRDSATRRRQKQELETRINRWIGEAYLDGGQFELSQRYLQRAESRLEGAERQTVLAELSFLSRQLGDRQAAARYGRMLSRPYSSDVASIVDGTSSRLAVAAKKHGSRRPTTRAAPKSRVARATKKPVRRKPTTRRKPSSSIRVFDRDDWNARAPKTSSIKRMGKVTRITIHHSAGKSFWAHSQRDTATHIRSIQRYHQEQRHWADIGYHYVVDRTGNIWKGRDRRYQGAHASGENDGNIGIVVLGNYTRQGLNASQVRSLANLVAQLSDSYGVPHYRVYTHEELQPGHTACPGPVLARVVEQIRGKLRERHLAMMSK